jgi:iron complex outermembrane receptor protein
LPASIASLDSLVVIGYGTSKKKDLTGAVSSVKEKDFNKGTFTSPDLLIQGKVPGVQIITNNGQPGGATTVKIRGSSALTGTGQPLYVIDGIPLDGRSLQPGNNPLNFLNPADIESIDVLKDASATAIYGSRAAYGVMIINTKKGQTGPAKLDVAVSMGIISLLKKVKVLDANQYRDAIKYYGVSNSYDFGGNVDAIDAIMQNGLQQNYSIAGSGGNDNGKYRFSAGLLDQEGLLINTSFKKYNGTVFANLRFLESKKLGLDLYLNSSQYIKDGSLLSGGNYGIVTAALNWNPTESLRNSDGSLNVRPGGNGNPVAFSEMVRDNLKVTTVLGSISPYYKFTNWLEYKLLISINYGTGISRSSVHQALMFPGYPIGSASISNNELTTKQITHTLNFNKEIFHDLHLNGVIGYEYMKFTSKGFGLSGMGVGGTGFGNYGLDYTNYVQYSDAGARRISSYIDPLYELQSFFGRTIFNYEDKYLLTATLRADGSTKFGPNNKYGYFPSFAAAWNINKEIFFKIDFINSLKIRVGWGKTGNQEFPAGSSQALYAFGSDATLTQVNNPNPDLKWQSDRQYNIGIDFSMFNNMIWGTIDYFNKATTNLLFPSPPIQPAPAGSSVTWQNLNGEILNNGLEFLINAAVIKKEKIGFDLSVNATFIKNNVSNLPTPVYTGYAGGFPIEIIQNGYPMNTFYTRKFLGMDESTGFSIYEDDGNTFYYVGDPNPKTVLGFSATFRYDKFSVIANMNGAFGQDIYNLPLNFAMNVSHINTGQNIALSVFQDPVKEKFANPVTYSSRYVQHGSYLKMANLTLSYNLGKSVKIFKGASIYVTGQNLFIITNYPGFDPELNPDFSNNSVPSLGIDGGNYPSSRSIIFGINCSL